MWTVQCQSTRSDIECPHRFGNLNTSQKHYVSCRKAAPYNGRKLTAKYRWKSDLPQRTARVFVSVIYSDYRINVCIFQSLQISLEVQLEMSKKTDLFLLRPGFVFS